MGGIATPDPSQQPITADDPRVQRILALIRSQSPQNNQIDTQNASGPTPQLPQQPMVQLPMPQQPVAPQPQQPVQAQSAPVNVSAGMAPSSNLDPTTQGLLQTIHNQPAPKPGPIKSFLQHLAGGLGNALYQGGQAGLQHVGLPTDYEKQQNALKIGLQQQQQKSLEGLRQTEADKNSQTVLGMQAQLAPFQIPDDPKYGQLAGMTLPTSAALPLMQKMEALQNAKDIASGNNTTKLGVAQIGATSREDLGRAALEYRQAIADRNYGVARERLGILQAGLGLRTKALQAALYGTDLNNNPLPGAAQIADDNGNVTTVGSRFAPNAEKQQKTVATFNDLGGSVKNLRAAIMQFQKEGGDLRDPVLAAAAADPNSTVGKVINGQLFTGGLTPTEITLLNAQRQTMEQAGILRSTTGGTASEAGAQRILATVPRFGQDTNASALSKLNEQEQVLQRLAKGQSSVHGGVNVTNRPKPSSNPTPNTPSNGGLAAKYGGFVK